MAKDPQSRYVTLSCEHLQKAAYTSGTHLVDIQFSSIYKMVQFNLQDNLKITSLPHGEKKRQNQRLNGSGETAAADSVGRYRALTSNSALNVTFIVNATFEKLSFSKVIFTFS